MTDACNDLQVLQRRRVSLQLARMAEAAVLNPALVIADTAQPDLKAMNEQRGEQITEDYIPLAAEGGCQAAGHHSMHTANKLE